MDPLARRVEELVARFGAPDACLAGFLCDGHDPDAAAFVVVHDDFSTEMVTYGDLRARSEAVAAGLLELGVTAGDAVDARVGALARRRTIRRSTGST
jgi:acetyl-CoA synthetase